MVSDLAVSSNIQICGTESLIMNPDTGLRLSVISPLLGVKMSTLITHDIITYSCRSGAIYHLQLDKENHATL